MTGARISRYRIIDQIGQGGMGEVYLAEDGLLGRQVALKIPRYDRAQPELIRRFLAEMRHAAELTHPNIAQVYDCGECADGRPFVVMEFVRGQSLSETLKNGALAAEQACGILDGLLAALEEAHGKGLVHRDVKPGNVMVGPRGEVKVLDFGLAKAEAAAQENYAPAEARTTTVSEHTSPGAVIGTPRYMSPEQILGAGTDRRSDLFGAGVVFYECLTGQPAFEGATLTELQAKVLETMPAPPSELRPELGKRFDAFLKKALAKKPAGRFEDAAAMRRALHQLRSRRLGRRGKLALAMTAAAALGVLGWFALNRTEYRPAAEAARFYREGVAAIQDGTAYRASLALERAVALDPAFLPARLRLAEARADLDYLEGAQGEFLKALGGQVQRLSRQDRLFLETLRLRLSRDFAQAVKFHQQIVDSAPEPDKARALVDLGRAYERNQETGKALEQYREAARRDPAYAAARLGIANMLARQQKASDAARELDLAEASYRALSNAEGVEEVMLRRGSLVAARNRAEARAIVERALAQARAIGSVYQETQAILLLSDLSRQDGETESAERQAREAVELARKNSLATLAARGLVTLGNACLIRGEYRRAEEFFTEALQYARNHDQPGMAARATMSLASAASQQTQPERVLQLTGEAQEFFGKGGYRQELFNLLVLRSRALRDLGGSEDALKTAEGLQQLARQAGNDNMMAMAEETLASIFFAAERYAESLEVSRRAASLNRKVGNRVGIGYSQLRAAKSAGQMGRFAEAEAALKEADGAAGNTTAGVVALRNRTLLARAELALWRDRTGEAAALARQVIQRTKAEPERSLEAELTLAHAQAHSRQGQAALRLLEAARERIGKAQDRQLSMRANLIRAEALRGAGRAAEARRALAESLAELEKRGQWDSAWHAALMLGGLGRQTKDGVLAASGDRKAAEIWKQLSQHWTEDMRQVYLDRPDRIRYR